MGEGVKIVAANRKARFEYHIIESVEAGIVLTGAEIKSLRTGEVTIAEGYIRPDRGELLLLNVYIRPYSHTSDPLYDPLRPRKLLLHRREIDRLIRQLEAKGMTLVPLDIHLKNGRAKVEVGLAKGKSAPDKRQEIKKRETSREIARALSSKRG
jgi:SsrA-binding protein